MQAALLIFCMSMPVSVAASVSDLFAGCVGRLSAETEHAWLMGDPAAENLESQRATFISLLSAVTSQNEARRVLTYRIQVKMAHASLLTLATFGADEVRSARARVLAGQYLRSCQNLLLDS
jgi:hypothetical protein